jgi:hypothetical protein
MPLTVPELQSDVAGEIKEVNMPCLVINAPQNQVDQNNKKSFEETLKSGLAEGYAINSNLFKQVYPGCGVVLLSKDLKRRAKGKLVRLNPTYKTKNGIQRYNVVIKNLKEAISYKSERLNRNGVTVIRCGTAA